MYLKLDNLLLSSSARALVMVNYYFIVIIPHNFELVNTFFRPRSYYRKISDNTDNNNIFCLLFYCL